MFLANELLQQIKKISYALVDLHDPSGSHYHRAWKACLAGLLAAAIIYLAPAVGQPLMVVAALIFTHLTDGRTPRRQQLTMLRAVLIVILGTCLLGLTHDTPLLQAVIVVILSFLAQYVVRFGSEYSSTFVWILILIAIAENPPVAEIPKIILNVAIGFILAFVCFFGFFPYNAQRALEAMANQTKYRLGNLLNQVVSTLDQQTRQSTEATVNLKRRIVSLIKAQQANLKQVQANPKLGKATALASACSIDHIAVDQQMISTQEEIFEAIMVLEQALSPLKYSHIASVQLKPLLKKVSDQVSALLNRSLLNPIHPGDPLSHNPDVVEKLQQLTANSTLSLENRIHCQTVARAIQTLFAISLPQLVQEPNQKSNSETINQKINSKLAEPNKPLTWGLDFNDPVTRRATRTAIAVTITLILGRWLNLPHSDWVVVSAFIVSRDSVGDTFWKAQGRLVGTVFGVVAALAFYGLTFRYHTLIFVIAFLTIFPYLYLRPSLTNYGYAKFFQQVAFICFLGSLGQHPSVGLLEWRAIDIAVGCAIGVAVALLVLPTWTRLNWKQGLIKAWTDCQIWFQMIVAECQSATFDTQYLQQLSRKAQDSAFELDKDLESRKHESIMSRENLVQRLALIQAQKKIYETLLALNYLALCSRAQVQSGILLPEVKALIQQILTAFEEMRGLIDAHKPPQLPLIPSRYQLPVQDNQEADKKRFEQFIFPLQLNQLCDAIEQYGEVRRTFSNQQRLSIHER